MKSKSMALLCGAAWLALAGPACLAQSTRSLPHPGYMAATGNGTDNLEWAEEEVPPPPAFSRDKLIPLEMPPQVTLKIGVDPETISVGGDGVVRYVVVMRNASGNTSAFYEGIRCASDEVRTYARQSGSGEWSMARNSTWKGLNENMPSHHAQAFARQGGCQAKLATSKQEIIKVLRTSHPSLTNVKTE